MIKLYQFPPAFGLPVSVSPYCAKLEAYLRLTNREYETAKGNLLKSPNKLVPYISIDGGAYLADSTELIKKFEAEGPALDRALTDELREQGQRLENLAQDIVYFSVLYSRFGDPDGWAHQKPTLKPILPPVIGLVLTPLIRKSQIKKCVEAGQGTMEAAKAQACAALDQLTDAATGKKFLLDDEPHVADCSVWGNLMQAAATLSKNPVTERVRNDEVLMGFIERMSDRVDLHLPNR